MNNNSHTDCFHTNTKQARTICRKVRQALDLAIDLGLEVTWSDCSDTPEVRQVSIHEAGRPWYGTSLTVTWSSIGVNILRFPGAGPMEKVPSTHLLSWIETLAR